MINTKDCFKKRLLTKTNPSLGMAKKSLRQSKFFLKEGNDLIELDKKEMAVIALYNSFFHTSRALLFRDGIKERSHFCVARYIESEYVDKKIISHKYLDHLDVLRDMRHETQYMVDTITIEADLEEISKVCKEFTGAVEKLITENL